MLVQSLVNYYNARAAKQELPVYGWCQAKVSFALRLTEDGQLLRIFPLTKPEERGKKTVEVPQIKEVPEQIKRTAGVAAQFLCDNAAYMLGFCPADSIADEKKRLKELNKTEEKFKASAAKHCQLLAGVQSKAAQAVVKFFAAWSPQQAAASPLVQAQAADLAKGGNCIFRVGKEFVQDDEAVRQAWNEYLAQRSDAPHQQCAVSGKYLPIARLHPSLKGIAGAQSTGASLVSFNAPAYESYGKDNGQGLNAPLSEQATFAYTTALNSLLADKEYVARLSDTTIVCWCEDGDKDAEGVIMSEINSSSQLMDINEVREVIKRWKPGHSFDFEQMQIPCANRFYILGLAPSAARASVRFFLQDTFGGFLSNMKQHFERLEIIVPAYIKKPALSLADILQETVNKNSKDKKPSAIITGSTLRAILTGALYPVGLYQQLMLRIKAECGNITYARAAIIKAYLLKNGRQKWEGLTVSVNETAKDTPYVLGRLFAVLEHLQTEAHGDNLNTTIKDRYFNAASTTPAFVFPSLLRLAGNHLEKLKHTPNEPDSNTNSKQKADEKEGKRKTYSKSFFDRQITELMGKLELDGKTMPRFLSLEEQGVFMLGYYHQVQKRFTKKEEVVKNG